MEQNTITNIKEIASKNWHDVCQGPFGPGLNQEPCVVCGRGVTVKHPFAKCDEDTTTLWVWVDATNGDLIPFGTDGPDHDDHGLQPIGPDCYKRHAKRLQGLVQRM